MLRGSYLTLEINELGGRCATEVFSTTCAVQRIVRVSGLLWVSGRARVAQTRGVLDLTHGGCRPFHFPLV